MPTKLNFNFALNLIPMLAGVALLAHPELEGPDIEAKVEDGAWAALRDEACDKAAIVDRLRQNPIISELVHLAISKEVAAAQAELEGEAEKGTAALLGGGTTNPLKGDVVPPPGFGGGS